MISEFVEYVKQVWKNKPNVSSPLNADRLNHMEAGIENNSKKIKETVTAVNELTEKIKISEGGYIGVRPFWEDGVIYLDFMRDSKNGAIICFNGTSIMYFKVENGTQTRIWSK